MRSSFENIGTATFLVLTPEEGEEPDRTALGMLTANAVPGVLPCSYAQIGDRCKVRYNVSSRITLENYLTGKLGKDRVLGILTSINEALLAAEDFLLDSRRLSLDRSLIFADVRTGDVGLVYLPFPGPAKETDLLAFTKELLFHIRFDEDEDTGYVVYLMGGLSRRSDLTPEDGMALVREVEERFPRRVPPSAAGPYPGSAGSGLVCLEDRGGGPVPGSRRIGEAAAAKGPAEGEAPGTPVREREMTAPLDRKDDGKTAKWEKRERGLFSLFLTKRRKGGGRKEGGAETAASPLAGGVPGPVNGGFGAPKQAAPAVLRDAGAIYRAAPGTGLISCEEIRNEETVILPDRGPGKSGTGKTGAGKTGPGAFLRRERTGRTYGIEKEIFHIGQERTLADLLIADNRSVSHAHADIRTRDGRYFLVDTNSLNHSYLNGKMLTSGLEYELKSGDTIRLADEEFTFRIR